MGEGRVCCIPLKGAQPTVILWPGKYKSMEVELVHECQNQESILTMYNHSSPLDAQSSYGDVIFHDKKKKSLTTPLSLILGIVITHQLIR